jgi:hypothetical protein
LQNDIRRSSEGKTTHIVMINVMSGSGAVRAYAIATAVKVVLPCGISDPVPLITPGESDALLVLRKQLTHYGL